MPEAAAAVVVEYFALEGAAAIVATIATQIVVTYAANAAISAVFGGDSGGQSSGAGGTAAVRVTNATVRQSAAPRRLIFGRVKTGGVLAWVGQTGDGRAHLLVALGEGPIEAVENEFFIGEDLSTATQFAGLVSLESHSGAAGKTTNAGLVADFPSERSIYHIGQGIADAVVRYSFNINAFPRGLVLPVFVVKGLQCYDPRTGTTVWTQNPAIVALYIERSAYGYATPDDLIDFDSFSAAANICEEVLLSESAANLVDGVPYRVRRYTFDGVFETSSSPADMMQTIVNACAGARITRGGRTSFYAGAYRAPTGPTLTAEYLRAPASLRTHAGRQQRVNVARGTYREPRQDWQSVDFAPQVDAAGITADGLEVVQNYSYPCTTIGAIAQRLARIAMRRARAAVPLALQCNWAAMQWQLWDVVSVSLPLLGIEDQPYVIVDYTYAQGGGVDLTLIPEDPAYYTWTAATDERLVPQVLAPDFGQTVPAVIGLAVTGEAVAQDYGWLLTLSASWSAISYAFLKHYEINWGTTSGGVYTHSATTTALAWSTNSVSQVAYDVRVRAVGTDDTYGPWSAVTGTVVSSDVTPPAVPTALSVTGSGTHTINWTTPADTDFLESRVYSNTSFTPIGATLIATLTGSPSSAYNTTHTPGGTRWYYVSAIDTHLNASALTYAGTAT